MEFDKIKEEILLIGECIEYIEENINKNTSTIIKELQNKHNLSRLSSPLFFSNAF